MSSMRQRKTKARFVFSLFSKLDVEYNSQPKMCCKYCKWTVTKNATRMANHIISACKSCPPDIKKNVYLIQTKDIKQPHLSIKDEAENNLMINNDDELTRISGTSNNDSTNNIEFNDNAMVDDDDDIVIHEEVIEYSNPLSNNLTETHNYSKPNREQLDNKYKFTLVSSNNNDTKNLDNKFKTESTLKLNESITELNKCDEYKKESRAFGNWVTSEIDDIGDLEILNQMKHDISNILYNSKKEYLQKLKQSGWSNQKIKSLKTS